MNMTLALLKPHILKDPIAVKRIKDLITSSGLTIVKSKRLLFTADISNEFYNEHKSRFFYNRLVTFMASGLSEAYILTGVDAVTKWRELMGPTKVYQTIYTHPNSIRANFGLTDTRNAAHGSDSDESAIREINVIFPEYNIEEIDKVNKM